MNLAVFVPHNIQIQQGNGNRLREDAEKSTDVDKGLAANASAVDMI